MAIKGGQVRLQEGGLYIIGQLCHPFYCNFTDLDNVEGGVSLKVKGRPKGADFVEVLFLRLDFLKKALEKESISKG